MERIRDFGTAITCGEARKNYEFIKEHTGTSTKNIALFFKKLIWPNILDLTKSDSSYRALIIFL